jgi:hypothetical protein
MIRTATIVALLAAAGIGCAADSQKSQKLDYCTCEMWGVMGVDPGPDYQPPPRPAACNRILKRKPEQDCPVPP